MNIKHLESLSGVVYGTLLNHSVSYAALAAKAELPPYKGASKAPVLYVKPRNTLVGSGEPVAVPQGVDQLEIGATLGIVIGRAACNIKVNEALSYVAGYVIVNDVSIPHDVFYRPSVRLKARDGFCPIGPMVVALNQVGNPDNLKVNVFVDDVLIHSTTTGQRRRPVAQLLADVTEFMTLSPGDVLMLGVSADAPTARSGQRVRIVIEHLGELENSLISEEVGL
jgi:5-oxopent-3-ene-1,2,5-tricarboxylate decarboxylase / 2-hydroxyhepta-2,4-diene-1,7-dioate isomerase